MQIKKSRGFELRLSKLGVALFTLGVSCLLLIAFALGVMVGKNIETYPAKITGAIPGLIREKIDRTPLDPGVAAAPGDIREARKEDLKLTFYDTLTGKKTGETKGEVPPPGVQEEKSPVKEKPAAQDKPQAKENYIVRVASLKDEKKAQELQKKLSGMGYKSILETREMGNKGTFYRISLRGFETKDEAAKASGLVQKKMKLKCLVVNAK
jgi:hypothetical protein